MAVKVFFLLALIAVVVNAESDCNCDPNGEVENKALWNFLSKLSMDLDDPEDKEMHAVLPGVLSPLLECNCLEKNRRKRKIMPEVEEASPESQADSALSEADAGESVREKKSIHPNTTRCPQGRVWYGFMCVPEEFLDESSEEQ